MPAMVTMEEKDTEDNEDEAKKEDLWYIRRNWYNEAI